MITVVHHLLAIYSQAVRLGTGIVRIKSVCLLAFAMMVGGTVQAASINFSFTLDRAYSTSAGAFKQDGTLVRTLWRNEPYATGKHTATWDGMDDQGVAAPAGTYQIRVLTHNVKYVWEGVVGNTSKSLTGPNIWKTFLPIQGMASGGDVVYCATGYNEGQQCLVKFRASDVQARIPLSRSDPFTAFHLVASDGVRSYWATNGVGVMDKKACFVMALNVQNDAVYPFPQGQDIVLNVNYPEQNYKGVIDFTSGSLNKVGTGLAVQRQGDILAVAHGNEDTILLYNKVSGAYLSTIVNVPLSNSDVTDSQLAMTTNGDLWVLCGTTARLYTDLSGVPRQSATISGLSAGRAIATDPTNGGLVLISDGGASQQVKAFDKDGKSLWTLGEAGGYTNDPSVTNDKFHLTPALCMLADGSFWFGDDLNSRLLHFSASRQLIETIAYLPHFYVSTVDLNKPTRAFAGYLEFEVDYSKALTPGTEGSWRLVKNWAAGYPDLQLGIQVGDGWGGLKTVVTLPNGRTYGYEGKNFVELPANGKMRRTGIDIGGVLYADGSVRYSNTAAGKQTVYQKPLTGFDGTGNPQWGPATVLATMPAGTNDPAYKGAFSGPLPARFPVTASGVVISFDPGVLSNGFHLGGAKKGDNRWLWEASPSGWTNGKGNFQTKAIDGSVNYGGNMVWASGQNVVYGYHGEGWLPSPTAGAGQANKFMHFWDDGLFVGEFGVGSEYWGNGGKIESPPGMAGNSFSPVLVTVNKTLYLWHNDESCHAGMHRWRLDGADNIAELAGTGTLGQSTVVDCTPSGPVAIQGRKIFYNGSKFDKNNAAANSDDDAAIATDKQALLPGETATFANYTSYSKGLNGIMLDISGLPGTPTASDFAFSVGNSIIPGAWPAAPAPTSVTVRKGAGAGGSDRLTLIWADNAIQKQWLRVTVNATGNTGLSTADVFYFGNIIGDTGNSATDANVDGLDLSLIRANQSGFSTIGITSPYDFNRDGVVDGLDLSLVRGSQSGLTPVALITSPGASGAAIAGAAIAGAAVERLPAALELLAEDTNEPGVVGRWVFYNNSKFDKNKPGANGADDAAIAVDKEALLPGWAGSFRNYTSYSRGINGIMVDIRHLTGTPTAGDFLLHVGNDNTPGAWSAGPAPTTVTVRKGAGVGGADRVTIIWKDNAIEKQWLQVTVKATSNTGLATPDVFYFGNAIGETGNSIADAIVDAADLAGAQGHRTSSAAVTSTYDFNRDGAVDAADAKIARTNSTSSRSAMKLINPLP